MRRLAIVLALGLIAAVLPCAAGAQEEGEAPAPPPPPEPPPPPPPAARSATASARPAISPGAAGSDHEEVVGALGFQLAASASSSAPLMPNLSSPVGVVGVRYWFNDKVGLDAGLGFLVSHVPDQTGFGFGIEAGVPLAIGIYKHITTFFEPSMDFFLFKNNGDADPAIQFDLLGSMGFEWQLGWVEASRISLTLRLGAGLQLLNNGTDTSFAFGTGGSDSVEGLFSTSFALTFYL